MKMKTLSSQKLPAWTAFTLSILMAGVAMAQPTPPPAASVQTRNVVVTTDGPGGEGAATSVGGAGSSRSVVKIESIEPARASDTAQEVTWLGVSTEEASEALASQLGLKPGQGLVVVFVAPDSPAAKAGIQKYDVIEEFGDQMLVGPEQLRKLVQMQKEGDTIKLTVHRAGKKQTVSVTLGKRTEDMSMAGGQGFKWVQGEQDAPMAVVHMDKQMVNAEVQRNMEEARQAIQEAYRQSAQAYRQSAEASRAVRPVAPTAPLPPIPPMAADLGNDATVTVTKDGDSVKTIAKSDDTGVIVIVANPKKHLTVHDQAGKLLFDGEIETPEQQQKVPPTLWEKIKPMLQQIAPAEDAEPQPHAESEGGQKL